MDKFNETDYDNILKDFVSQLEEKGIDFWSLTIDDQENYVQSLIQGLANRHDEKYKEKQKEKEKLKKQQPEASKKLSEALKGKSEEDEEFEDRKDMYNKGISKSRNKHWKNVVKDTSETEDITDKLNGILPIHNPARYGITHDMIVKNVFDYDLEDPKDVEFERSVEQYDRTIEIVVGKKNDMMEKFMITEEEEITPITRADFVDEQELAKRFIARGKELAELKLKGVDLKTVNFDLMEETYDFEELSEEYNEPLLKVFENHDFQVGFYNALGKEWFLDKEGSFFEIVRPKIVN